MHTSFMRKQYLAITLTIFSIPFTVYGAGHFYLRKFREGFLFLIIGYANLFLSFSYLPFKFDSLMGPNFLSIISEFNSTEIMAPVVTLVVWGGLISASIIRVAHLSKHEGISVKQ